jgi:heterokaryon incompatibility protein (HET)
VSFTTTSDLASRCELNILRGIIAKSVLVIQDAVRLISGTTSRFLWVDQLCIVRGDEESFSNALRRMNLIYSHAIVTIIAATGSDANGDYLE